MFDQKTGEALPLSQVVEQKLMSMFLRATLTMHLGNDKDSGKLAVETIVKDAATEVITDVYDAIKKAEETQAAG